MALGGDPLAPWFLLAVWLISGNPHPLTSICLKLHLWKLRWQMETKTTIWFNVSPIFSHADFPAIISSPSEFTEEIWYFCVTGTFTKSLVDSTRVDIGSSQKASPSPFNLRCDLINPWGESLQMLPMVKGFYLETLSFARRNRVSWTSHKKTSMKLLVSEILSLRKDSKFDTLPEIHGYLDTH